MVKVTQENAKHTSLDFYSFIDILIHTPLSRPLHADSASVAIPTYSEVKPYSTTVQYVYHTSHDTSVQASLSVVPPTYSPFSGLRRTLKGMLVWGTSNRFMIICCMSLSHDLYLLFEPIRLCITSYLGAGRSPNSLRFYPRPRDSPTCVGEVSRKNIYLPPRSCTDINNLTLLSRLLLIAIRFQVKCACWVTNSPIT